jgi:hypothetical protein
VAVVLNAGSYLGLGMSWIGGAFAIIHLVLMVLGFVLFARISLHHSLAWRAAGTRIHATPLPVRLIMGTIAALIYLLVTALAVFVIYGEGSAEVRNGQEVWVNGDSVVRTLAPGSVAAFDSFMLRVFSAAWIFFGLLIALVSHRVEERIRGYRAARHSAS